MCACIFSTYNNDNYDMGKDIYIYIYIAGIVAGIIAGLMIHIIVGIVAGVINTATGGVRPIETRNKVKVRERKGRGGRDQKAHQEYGRKLQIR